MKYLSIEDKELLHGFRTTFIEPPGCSEDLEQLISDAIDGSEFPAKGKNNARNTLKG